jgi:hypothetical protein
MYAIVFCSHAASTTSPQSYRITESLAAAVVWQNQIRYRYRKGRMREAIHLRSEALELDIASNSNPVIRRTA